MREVKLEFGHLGIHLSTRPGGWGLGAGGWGLLEMRQPDSSICVLIPRDTLALIAKSMLEIAKEDPQ